MPFSAAAAAAAAFGRWIKSAVAALPLSTFNSLLSTLPFSPVLPVLPVLYSLLPFRLGRRRFSRFSQSVGRWSAVPSDRRTSQTQVGGFCWIEKHYGTLLVHSLDTH